MAVTATYRASVTTVQKVSSGIFSITPSSQNRPKVSIAGTVFLSSDHEGKISGDIRVHNGSTPGGISIPPPGTVSHIITKKGNNQLDHLAGAINKNYLQTFLVSSNFPKVEKDGSSHTYNEWAWLADSISIDPLYPGFQGLYYDFSTARESSLDPNWNSLAQSGTPEIKDLAFAISKKMSCNYELEFIARTFTPLSGTLPVNTFDYFGALLAYIVDGSNKVHTLTAIRSPITGPSNNYNPLEIYYNYGQSDEKRIINIPASNVSVPSHDASSYINEGYMFRVKRNKNLIEVQINANGGLTLDPALMLSVDLQDPAHPELQVFDNEESGKYGICCSHRDYLFDNWAFVDHTRDFEVPDGWLFADGSVLSKSEYGALYENLGDVWNKANTTIGINEFQIPDFRGYFLRCYKNSLISGDFGEGTKKEDTVKKHGHYVLTDMEGGHEHQYWKWEFDSTLGDPKTAAGVNALGYRGVYALQREALDDRGLFSANNFIHGSQENFIINGTPTKGVNVMFQTDDVPIPSTADTLDAGVSRDDMSPIPDVVLKGDNTSFSIDVPQQHLHEVLLDNAQNTDPNIPIGEGTPVNIKIQTFIKY